MRLPMSGSWVVQVQAVRPFTIHGDQYFELQVARVDADTVPVLLSVPLHALTDRATPPAAGSTMELTFLMGQVTGASAISRK